MTDLQESLEKLKAAKKELESVQIFYDTHKFAEELISLKELVQTENFWQKPEYIQASKKLSELEDVTADYKALLADFSSLQDLAQMFGESVDEEELVDLTVEINRFSKRLSSFKLELLLSGEFDKNNCFLSINPGAGGTESQDWAEMLLRMYLRFCERHKFTVTVLDYQKANEAGIKSASLFIKGKNVYGFLKSEAGIHRLVRISPFDANKRRHTSFAAVSVSPEVETAGIEIKDEDLKIDTYRSGGAGGQHVNTTDSAVRITHLPTGIVAQCQNERSQHQNRQQAMKMLFSKIVEFEERKKKELADRIEKQKIEWGSQIRSYVLHPYKMIKDHRTNYESGQPELILDGELDEVIESVLINQ